MEPNHPIKALVLTAMALMAFAANSVLCRLALGAQAIDAASFTTIRLVSGAVLLWVMSATLPPRTFTLPKWNWPSAGFLFGYAICFSFAYTGLTAGTGALILFGAVQTTMIGLALRSGERPHSLEWVGLMAAIGGLVYLVFPGLTAPPLVRSGLMALAGVAWGVYSLRGRGSKTPLADTTSNFVYGVPLAVLVNALMWSQVFITPKGVVLALLSGSLASGVGYVIWYAALKYLTATRAATVQLAVPVLAAAGGVVVLSEQISLRLVIAAVLILGGIGVALLGRKTLN